MQVWEKVRLHSQEAMHKAAVLSPRKQTHRRQEAES